MMNVRRTASPTADVARLPQRAGAPSAIWREALSPVLAAAGFVSLLLSDALDPLALILLQIYLAF